MKRRNRVLLMWMLTGIWLCVQSPWTHAQRVQAHAHALEQAAAPVAQVLASDPCHGDEHPPAPAKFTGCHADGHCDGQCAQLFWALAAATPRLMLRGAILLTPVQVAGVQGMRQPELFRPPI